MKNWINRNRTAIIIYGAVVLGTLLLAVWTKYAFLMGGIVLGFVSERRNPSNLLGTFAIGNYLFPSRDD